MFFLDAHTMNLIERLVISLEKIADATDQKSLEPRVKDLESKVAALEEGTTEFLAGVNCCGYHD